MLDENTNNPVHTPSPGQMIPTLEAQPRNHYQLWNLNKSTRWLQRLGGILFAYLLSKSIGTYSIRRLDYLMEPRNSEEWRRYRDAIVARVNNMVVVGSLVIAYVLDTRHRLIVELYVAIVPQQSLFQQHLRTQK
ncbi:hypothetical protein FRB94_009962 [Tulasnella sp. JGI-2019a]|nr:hypothetical protein FRB94_009962 [Tulasnella sp. JGI-2019a]